MCKNRKSKKNFKTKNHFLILHFFANNVFIKSRITPNFVWQIVQNFILHIDLYWRYVYESPIISCSIRGMGLLKIVFIVFKKFLLSSKNGYYQFQVFLISGHKKYV